MEKIILSYDVQDEKYNIVYDQSPKKPRTPKDSKLSSNSIRGKIVYRKNLPYYDKTHMKFFDKNIPQRNIF